MLTTNPTQSYGQAQALLRLIDQEANRPIEDVVPQFVGDTARQCIRHFLSGFLTEHGTAPDPAAPLTALLEQAREIDPRFLSVDQARLSRLMDSDYDDDRVIRRGSELAEQIQQLVLSSSANRL